MFAEPTINDFINQMHMHREAGFRSLGHEVQAGKAMASKQGALGSSRTIIMALDAMDQAFDNIIGNILGEVRRAREETKLDAKELRTIAAQSLEDIATAIPGVAQLDRMQSWIKSDGIRQMVADRQQGLKDRLRFRLRQFDVGFDKPAAPEGNGTTNIIKADSMVGTTIMQASHNSQQTVSIHLDYKAVSNAVEAAEHHLSALPDSYRRDIEAELATLRAQLTKAEPSPAILREAGKSIRNIAEGVLGGMLTAPAAQAFTTLAGMLGA